MSKQTIWNKIRALGFNEFAAAGIMANIEAESAYLANNAQDCYGWDDASYTNGVDSGSYSRSQFSRDAVGYGLCQWTYWSRKQGLYDFAQARGVSIGDETMQLDWMYTELSTGGYTTCYRDLLGATSAYDAGYSFCVNYEQPANTIAQGQTRGNRSIAIYNEFSGTAVTEVQEVTEVKQDTAAESSGNLHVVRYGDRTWYGNALQSLLKAHGYSISVDMDVRNGTMDAFNDFAAQYGLDPEADFGQLIYLLFEE